jgi:hypothetical protein
MKEDDKARNNTCVYVKGYGRNFKDDLKKLFATSGKIQRITIQRDTHGKPRGIALLEFETHEQAAAAVLLNNTLVNGKSLHVSFKALAAESAAEQEKEVTAPACVMPTQGHQRATRGGSKAGSGQEGRPRGSEGSQAEELGRRKLEEEEVTKRREAVQQHQAAIRSAKAVQQHQEAFLSAMLIDAEKRRKAEEQAAIQRDEATEAALARHLSQSGFSDDMITETFSRHPGDPMNAAAKLLESLPAKKKAEEEDAAAKKKATDEEAAKTNAGREAAAKKKAEDEAKKKRRSKMAEEAAKHAEKQAEIRRAEQAEERRLEELKRLKLQEQERAEKRKAAEAAEEKRLMEIEERKAEARTKQAKKAAERAPDAAMQSASLLAADGRLPTETTAEAAPADVPCDADPLEEAALLPDLTQHIQLGVQIAGYTPSDEQWQYIAHRNSTPLMLQVI